jgi:hypothetical protein
MKACWVRVPGVACAGAVYCRYCPDLAVGFDPDLAVVFDAGVAAAGVAAAAGREG